MNSPTSTSSLPPFVSYLEDPHETNVRVSHAIEAGLTTAWPWIAAAVLLAVCALVAVTVVRRWLRTRWTAVDGDVVLSIELPPGIDPKASEMFWQNVHDLLRPKWRRRLQGQPHISFEIVWSGADVAIQVWVPGALSSTLVERSLMAAYPGIKIQRREPTDLIPASASVDEMGALQLAEHECLPIECAFTIDPLRFVVGSLSDLPKDRGAFIQVLARPATSARVSQADPAENGQTTWWRGAMLFVLDVVTPGSTTPKSGPKAERNAADRANIAHKLSALGWEVAVRYGVHDIDAKRSVEFDAHGLAASFSVFSGRNRFRRSAFRSVDRINARWIGSSQLFSSREIAAVAHLPELESAGALARAGAKSVAPVPTVPSEGKVLGLGHGSGRPVAVQPNDARYHMHVMGSTGSGKSTLLTSMILQDIAAHRGTVVIDPKGDLVADVLSRLPEAAEERLLLIDPANQALSPVLSVLRGEDANLVVDNIVGVFRRIFEAHWGPRTDDLLRAACHTLIAARGGDASIADVPALLTDEQLRRSLTRQLDSRSELARFWSSYKAMSDSQQLQLIAPMMNKLRAFLLRDFARRVVGNDGTPLDLSDVLDGKVLLVRLPKGLIGDETASLIGSLVVAKVWQAAMARADEKRTRRADAAIYVDECQNFLNLPRSFDDILAESRGYGLSLVMAHQHLGQLSRELRDAISTNARNKAYFTMSPEDAHVLERHFAPTLGSHDLSHLGAYQLAARLVIDGQDQAPCTVQTLALGEESSARVEQVIKYLKARVPKSSSAQGVSGALVRSDTPDRSATDGTTD